MSITFQKRQKELKRQQKQRDKAERRAQRKLAKQAENEAGKQGEGAPIAAAEPEIESGPGQSEIPE